MIDDYLIVEFQVMLLEWYKSNKRTFEWRYTFNPYYVLISEILLQQTDANKVIIPYKTLIELYPSLSDLERVDSKGIITIFSSIGLFYRADRLKNICKQVLNKYGGVIPASREELQSISGIGNYIANSILCFGYNLPYAIVDTNIIRIYKRVFGIQSRKTRERDDSTFWDFAQIMLPENDFVDFNYALLDFGAIVCKKLKPLCTKCCLRHMCNFYHENSY